MKVRRNGRKNSRNVHKSRYDAETKNSFYSCTRVSPFGEKKLLKKLKRNRGASDSGWRNEYLITLLQLSDQDLGSVVIPFFTFFLSF